MSEKTTLTFLEIDKNLFFRIDQFSSNLYRLLIGSHSLSSEISLTINGIEKLESFLKNWLKEMKNSE